MARKSKWAAALAALALLVTGCSGGDPDENQNPDVVSTLAPSEPQTATAPDEAVPRASEPPELPRGATKNSVAGAEAFVGYWIDVLNYAKSTGYVDTLQSTSTTSCGGCRGYIESFATTYGSGGAIRGGDATLTNLQTVPGDFGVDWSGLADVKFEPFTLIDSEEPPERITGDTGRLTLEATWESGAWTMQFFAITAQP